MLAAPGQLQLGPDERQLTGIGRPGGGSYLATMRSPEIALLMSTYQRPTHLRRALESIALQEGVDGRMQLVITDDGSTDETPEIVRQFAASVPFEVGFTTHPHTTFQLARCRNKGVRASRAVHVVS